MTNTSTGQVDLVNGVRVPEKLGTANYLRQLERKTSQHSCLSAFVTTSAQIEQVDDMRKIAGKIEYEQSHVYLYDAKQDRSLAREILWTTQVSPQAVKRDSRVIEVATSKSGEVDYVDGVKLPPDTTLVDYLRQQERALRRTSLVVFVKASARIETVENLRAVAENMGYQAFHAYVLDTRNPEIAVELRYGAPVKLDQLRSGPQGSVPLP
jgi:uncharacterized protein YbcV (DUF1398 family)